MFFGEKTTNQIKTELYFCMHFCAVLAQFKYGFEINQIKNYSFHRKDRIPVYMLVLCLLSNWVNLQYTNENKLQMAKSKWITLKAVRFRSIQIEGIKEKRLIGKMSAL